jgi:glutamate dehydrogenase (NADP+)
VLADRGTRVVPDVLANAGGVILSYFEWVQNRQGYPWTLDEVRERLEAMKVEAFADVWSVHESEGATLRAAVYTMAMRRIGEAIASHGTREYFQGDRG